MVRGVTASAVCQNLFASHPKFLTFHHADFPSNACGTIHYPPSLRILSLGPYRGLQCVPQAARAVSAAPERGTRGESIDQVSHLAGRAPSWEHTQQA